MPPVGKRPKIFRYELPPPEESAEVIPWTSVTRPRSARTGHLLVRYTLKPILREHVGIYVDGLDYIRQSDVGRTPIVDYDTDTKNLHAVITDDVFQGTKADHEPRP
jgi:hypothetical protein